MIRIAISVAVVLLAAAGGFWVGRSDNAARVAWLQDELDRYAIDAEISSREQLARSRQVADLSRTVAEYEAELANDPSGACPSDPAYNRRLRQILETGR